MVYLLMANMYPWLIDCRGVNDEEQQWGGTDTVSTLIRNCLCARHRHAVMECESGEDEK